MLDEDRAGVWHGEEVIVERWDTRKACRGHGRWQRERAESLDKSIAIMRDEGVLSGAR